jgi:putative membrane protein
VFSLAAILSAEIFLTAGAIDGRMALRLARVDAWFGVMAAIALAAGLLRVFLGAKGVDYYLAKTFFWAKMELFAAAGLISIAPTFSYLVWRRRVRADASYRPPASAAAPNRGASL